MAVVHFGQPAVITAERLAPFRPEWPTRHQIIRVHDDVPALLSFAEVVLGRCSASTAHHTTVRVKVRSS
jgi:hypothetical protein